MMRGFAVLVSALAAVSAQAQDARTSKAPGATGAVLPKESGQRGVMLASRSMPEPGDSPLTRSTRSGSPDSGATDAGAMIKEGALNLADCSMAESFLSGITPTVREYKAPPSKRGEREWEGAEETPPYVAAVGHCGQRYVFQVKSDTKEAWVIKGARLEGPKGEVLRVQVLRFGALEDTWSVNVIVAEAPPGAKLSKLKLHLTGQDGRVAQAEARDLP